MPKPNRLSTKSDEWYTPSWFLDHVRKTFEVLHPSLPPGIDFDPASCAVANKNVQASEYWTKDGAECGLTGPWPEDAKRVFMNPPYGRAAGGTGAWLQKASDECLGVEGGRTVIALVNANVGANYFHDTVWENMTAQAVWFSRGRIKFLDAEGIEQKSPTQYNAAIFFGWNRGLIEAAEEGFRGAPGHFLRLHT